MHKALEDRINDHHEGNNVLSEEELEKLTKRKEAFQKKRKFLEEDTPEKVCSWCVACRCDFAALSYQ